MAAGAVRKHASKQLPPGGSQNRRLLGLHTKNLSLHPSVLEARDDSLQSGFAALQQRMGQHGLKGLLERAHAPTQGKVYLPLSPRAEVVEPPDGKCDTPENVHRHRKHPIPTIIRFPLSNANQEAPLF